MILNGQWLNVNINTPRSIPKNVLKRKIEPAYRSQSTITIVIIKIKSFICSLVNNIFNVPHHRRLSYDTLLRMECNGKVLWLPTMVNPVLLALMDK